MKKLIFSIIASFCFLFAIAQPKDLLLKLEKGEIETEEYAKSNTSHYTKVVNLKTDQQIKFEKIYQKEADKLRLIASLKSDQAELYSKKEKAVFINTRQAVKLVLDRNQWRKYVLHERMNKLKK